MGDSDRRQGDGSVRTPSPIFVIGDVHGQLAKLIGLLREAGLIGPDGGWAGGASVLWLIGDLVDRGPDGAAVIALAMRLQREAAAAGGRVGALFGNHDGLLVAAYRFGETPGTGPDGTFLGEWQANGGEAGDLERLTDEQVAWLTSLPAMAQEGEHLLVHADALFYTYHGRTIAEVNQAFASILHGDDRTAWDCLLADFAEHRAFIGGEAGAARAAAFLLLYGGSQIVHGHSPISSITGQPPATVTGALIYADGLCVDVDGGMYRGGPGFVYRLPVLAGERQ
jgi:hypothetical protein